MPEIFRIAYNAGLGFTLGVLVALSITLLFAKAVGWLYDVAVKSIRKKYPKFTAEVEKKEAPKKEPQTFTGTSLAEHTLKDAINKDLLLGPLVLHPVHSIREVNAENEGNEFTVTYKTDKGSYAALTVKLNSVELENWKQ